MSDLTEKLKAGELEPAYYYVRIQDGSIMNIFFDENNIVDINGWEVLGAVPSYEEWQRIFHYAGKYEYEYTSCVMDYENLKEENKNLYKMLDVLNGHLDSLLKEDNENQQLKKLLRECIAHLSLGEMGTSVTPLNILLTRINAAIGESEE